MAGPLRDNSTWLLGQVVEFHPQTHTFTVTANGRIFRGVARLLEHPGDVVALPPQTLVAMHRELGQWIIAGVLNQAAAGQQELAPVHVTEEGGIGASDPVEPEPALGDARAPNAPTDVVTHDWVRHGELGQLFALLAGGTAVMKGSALAQVRAHQQTDLVEIVSHLFRHITAMGESEVTSENGRLCYTWRGAANEADAAPDVQRWTIRLDVGATGSGDIFAFSITTPAGQTLARIAMTPEGKLELRGTSIEVTAGSAGPAVETVASDATRTVAGSQTEEVGGNDKLSVLGSRTVSVSREQRELVGGNRSKVVAGGERLFTSGRVQRKVLGGLAGALPGAKAEVVEYVNGGVEVTIGSPRSGALPSAQQGANWVSYVGGFNFALQPSALPAPAGGFNVLALLPNSVNLGCDGGAILNPITGAHELRVVPAPFGVMKYEPFLALMEALIKWMQTHVHPTAVGPSGPAVVDPEPLLKGLLPAIRSVRVGVGA